MVLPPVNDCDECVFQYPQRSPVTVAVSALPFLLTFLVIALVVSHKLFPILSGYGKPGPHYTATLSPGAAARPKASIWNYVQPDRRSLASLIFSTNIALSAVLAELIFCEISNTANRATRSLALKITLPLLLFLLIIATPAFEIHSIIAGSGLNARDAQRGRRRVAWVLELGGLAAWLTAFWYLGRGFLGSYMHKGVYPHDHTFREGCLERIGIIGVSLMASLAGFAAISSLWQTFGVKHRAVTDSDIARRQAGIQATEDMLLSKGSRLRAVEHKLCDNPHPGFMGRMVGTVRGNPDVQERNMLQLEIQGLQTMRNTLQNSLTVLQRRRQSQQRAHTARGRAVVATSYIFAIYCAYRIGATAVSSVRRLSSPATTFSSSDPINNFLALLAKHWDPTIDREAWSRTISFLLSGVMLLLSFNSVLQTFYLFARIVPGLVEHTKTNFALLISQIAATYVISSALLLRSNLPPEMKNRIGDALGAPLESAFTEKWFEGWFLASCASTIVGLWMGRRMRGGVDDDEEEELGDIDVEMGKRS